jgi:hypothetical protein
MRIWHQGFTLPGDLPGYADAMRTHLAATLRPDTEGYCTARQTAPVRATILATIVLRCRLVEVPSVEKYSPSP